MTSLRCFGCSLWFGPCKTRFEKETDSFWGLQLRSAANDRLRIRSATDLSGGRLLSSGAFWAAALKATVEVYRKVAQASLHFLQQSRTLCLVYKCLFQDAAVLSKELQSASLRTGHFDCRTAKESQQACPLVEPFELFRQCFAIQAPCTDVCPKLVTQLRPPDVFARPRTARCGSERGPGKGSNLQSEDKQLKSWSVLRFQASLPWSFQPFRLLQHQRRHPTQCRQRRQRRQQARRRTAVAQGNFVKT